MKAFLIFVDTHAGSLNHIATVLNSIRQFSSWEPILFPGVNPDSLSLFEMQFPIQEKFKSRISYFKKHVLNTYLTKKSCFYNHYRVWKYCASLGEPVAFIEHDSICQKEWDQIKFKDILILNAESAIRQSIIVKNFKKHGYLEKIKLKDGIHEWTSPLYNIHSDDSSYPIMMPGTAAYAITPQCANRFIEFVNTHGWEQSDHFINSNVCTIEYILPQYFNLGLPNLNLSHGF